MVADERVRQLVELLRDRTADLATRDDAAMDLAEYDTPRALRALLDVAVDPEAPTLLQASAGESLAIMWLRNGLFRRETLDRFCPIARAEAEALLRLKRPEWLG